MAILQYFPINEFYKTVNPSEYTPGQICWVVTPHVNIIPQILDVERSRPEEHSEVKFLLRNADPDNDFRSHDRTLPIKYLNLASNEELLIQKAKKRPGIIISTGLDIYPEITKILKPLGKKHLQEDSMFIIPCYGTMSGDDFSGFPPEMVSRIRCLLYRQFFYLPAYANMPKESISRFDRIQIVVDRHRAAIEPTPLCLSDDVFSLFMSLFIFCISGIEDQNLALLRYLTREAYQPAQIKNPCQP